MKSKTEKKEITQEEIQEIERLTGGKIGTHTFGPNNEHTLENSFLSLDNSTTTQPIACIFVNLFQPMSFAKIVFSSHALDISSRSPCEKPGSFCSISQ